MRTIKFDIDQLPFVMKTDRNFWCVSASPKGRINFIDVTCRHRGGPLSHGAVVGDVIKCPWHGQKTPKCRLRKGSFAHLRNGREITVMVPQFQRLISLTGSEEIVT